MRIPIAKTAFFSRRRLTSPAPPRWTYVGDHEGYIAGYFLDAAVAHYRLYAGRDRRYGGAVPNEVSGSPPAEQFENR